MLIFSIICMVFVSLILFYEFGFKESLIHKGYVKKIRIFSYNYDNHRILKVCVFFLQIHQNSYSAICLS